MSKKESFVKGTLILAGAALIARLLGLFQRVPLEHILGDVGNASYVLANGIYFMLLPLATAGLPSTLSRMVSERHALNRPAESERIYQAALWFAAVTGIVMSLLLYFAAPYYAAVSRVPEAAIAIRTLAPALLIFPLIAIMRGYLQGRNIMIAGGISQVIEQIVRVGSGISLAFVLYHMNAKGEEIAAAATFGAVLGGVAALIVMLYFNAKTKRQDKKDGLLQAKDDPNRLPFSKIYLEIFKLSIPIVLSSLTVPAVNFIDGSILKPLLSQHIGSEQATYILGILGNRAQMIAGIPPILAIALSTSLLPIISAAFARKDEEHLHQQVTLAMRVSVLTGMPMVIALTTAAYSVNGLLFSTRDGSSIIAMLTFGTIFQITMMISNSILIGVDKVNLSMVHVGIGVTVKLALSLLLAPLLGIYGIILATILCFLTITLLNVRTMKKIVPFSIMGGRWTGFLLTVALLSGVGYGLNQAGIHLVSVLPDRLAFFVTCCIVGLAVVGLYPVLLVVLRVVRKDELATYPGPLRKLLSPLMRLQRGGQPSQGQ
ncbi:polysaccharide biosynthesis protein [Paenibacillus woosongensis]|uniref:Oligosaccharide flippase family protein n=1 Tax=Paenibacillus woosongensis TaxID=307580 RepID=A0A7X3CPE9_9BACL|nr:polysaccharide biosynthesis protein [Paenibacillus woosongensis]MUG47290.1 oligosaccharide flippase family protein [Paenibacillus woosongensis]